jgi:hypothetical protein
MDNIGLLLLVFIVYALVSVLDDEIINEVLDEEWKNWK